MQQIHYAERRTSRLCDCQTLIVLSRLYAEADSDWVGSRLVTHYPRLYMLHVKLLPFATHLFGLEIRVRHD